MTLSKEKKDYMLVNPYMQGSAITRVSASSPLAAANKLYKIYSNYVKSSIPHFKFTIKELTDDEDNTKLVGGDIHDKYYSFTVNEKPHKKGRIAYSIIPFNGKLNPNFYTNLSNIMNRDLKNNPELSIEAPQHGGARKKSKSKTKKYIKKILNTDDDDDDSSSSSEDYYPRYRRYPRYDDFIYYWWYDPTYYYLTRTYAPLFIDSIIPTVVFSV